MNGPKLETRQPTGKVAFPLVLLEGGDKSGKSFAALSLSASERIGRTFVLELDEPTADEYASLGDFEILEHNGTYRSIIGQLRAATAVQSDPEKPNLIVFDTTSAYWDLLKIWVDSRARKTKKAIEILRTDPDAEIDISMNLWNDAADRWNEMINLLRRWPGIAVVICRAEEVAMVKNGKPVPGQTDYSIKAHKSLPFAVNAHVRMLPGHQATLISARSLQVDVPRNGISLDQEKPLEHLVFGILHAGGEFAVPNLVVASNDDSEQTNTVNLAPFINTVLSKEEKTSLRENWKSDFDFSTERVPTSKVAECKELINSFVGITDIAPKQAEPLGQDWPVAAGSEPF